MHSPKLHSQTPPGLAVSLPALGASGLPQDKPGNLEFQVSGNSSWNLPFCAAHTSTRYSEPVLSPVVPLLCVLSNVKLGSGQGHQSSRASSNINTSSLTFASGLRAVFWCFLQACSLLAQPASWVRLSSRRIKAVPIPLVLAEQDTSNSWPWASSHL